jgi:hypothetical protein
MTRYQFRDTADGCIGSISIPLEGCGVLSLAAVGDDRADALGKAALLAERVADDPVMRALMPPQAQASSDAARSLASAAKRGGGPLRRAFSLLRGPGARRLAASLVREAAKRQAAKSEVGILPFALLAAKYGPGIAKAAHKAYKARKKRKAAKRKAATRAREPEPEQEPEQEPAQEPEQEPDNEATEGGDWIPDYADGEP